MNEDEKKESFDEIVKITKEFRIIEDRIYQKAGISVSEQFNSQQTKAEKIAIATMKEVVEIEMRLDKIEKTIKNNLK